MEPINFTHVLLACIGFLIVHVLNGIKSEIKDVKVAMGKLSENLTDIDRRLVAVETRCSTHHAD